jgi:hypothetical protein
MLEFLRKAVSGKVWIFSEFTHKIPGRVKFKAVQLLIPVHNRVNIPCCSAADTCA